MRDTVENFLKVKPPLGIPDPDIKIYCEYEVGGASKDWGWVIEFREEVIGCDKKLDSALRQARWYLETQAEKYR